MVDDLGACLHQRGEIATDADLSTQIGSHVGCTTQVLATCLEFGTLCGHGSVAVNLQVIP